MTAGRLARRHRRTLGMYLADDDPDRDHDEAFLIWFHGGADPIAGRAARRRLGRHLHRGRPHRASTASCRATRSPPAPRCSMPGPYGRGAAGRLTPRSGAAGVQLS